MKTRTESATNYKKVNKYSMMVESKKQVKKIYIPLSEQLRKYKANL